MSTLLPSGIAVLLLATGATITSSGSPTSVAQKFVNAPAVGELVVLVPGSDNKGLRYEALDLEKNLARKTVLAGYGTVQQGVVAPGGTMLAGSSPFKPQTKEHAFFLMVIDLKTGLQKEYWTSCYSSEYPAFNSDGRYLASVVWRKENSKAEIAVMDLATQREVILPPAPFDVGYAPTWKPGTADLFVVGVSAGSAAIYSISTERTSWALVWKPEAPFSSKSMDHHPKRGLFAFSGTYGVDRGAFLLDLSDMSVSKILDLPTSRLRFSPRGDALAFDTRTRGGSLGYYLLDTKQVTMFREFGDAIYPSWVQPSRPSKSKDVGTSGTDRASRPRARKVR